MFSLAGRPLSHHFTHRSWMEPCSARSPSGSAYKIPATEQPLHSECMQGTGASPDPAQTSTRLTVRPALWCDSPRLLPCVYSIQTMPIETLSHHCCNSGPNRTGNLRRPRGPLAQTPSDERSIPECRDTHGNTQRLSQGRPSDQLPHNYASACWPQALAHW